MQPRGVALFGRAGVCLLAAWATGCGDDTSSGAGGAGGAGSSGQGAVSSSSSSASSAASSTTATSSVGSSSSGAGGFDDDRLALLDQYLRGELDNVAQAAEDDGVKLVERHVCAIPGREAADVAWLYVEHVEVLPGGDRDAYFTRVNEVRLAGDFLVSRAYRFAEGHPLHTDAFSFNGERDGCTQPDVLTAIEDADLEYRDGCDVTFTPDVEVFHAATVEGSCSFPGGYIHTTAEVFAEGIDSRDVAVSGGTESGELYRFRKVTAERSRQR